MPLEITREYINNLQRSILNKDTEEAKTLLNELHAADIAEIYDELSLEEAKFLFLLLDGEKAGDVLSELEEDEREQFLKIIPSEIIAKQFIENMDSDDAADAMGALSDQKQAEVLSHIVEREHAGDIADLLTYDEDTAGGLMGKEFIAVRMNWSIITCVKEMTKQAEDIDEIYYIYVTDETNVLKGTLSLKKMLLAHSGAKVADIYNSNIISVRTDTEAEDVGNIMDKYDLVALPVVDNIGRLVGRITIDDVVDLIREEADKDYQMASGISSDIQPSDNVFQLTKARLPWLLIGLSGGILAVQVIGVYETDLSQNAATAFFIPLIAAMGGNVGVQSSAIVVQGLASKSVDLDSTFKKILKEISVAMINGLTCSSIILIYNLLFSSSLALTLSVSTALFIVIIFASTFGTLVPIILNKMKIDPALATGPFITTVNDILGLFIYLAVSRFFFGFSLF